MTTYYVDFSAGSDSNAGTSESTAFRTIAKVNGLSLSPGDSVLFKRGGSTTAINILLRSGVTYGAYGNASDPRPVITSKGTFDGNGAYGDTVSDVVIQDLDFQSCDLTPVHLDDCTNVTIRNVRGNGCGLIHRTSDDYNPTCGVRVMGGGNVVIDGCELTDAGPKASDMCYINGVTSPVLRNSYIRNPGLISGDGVQFSFCSDPVAENNDIAGNHVKGCIAMTGGSGTGIVRGNILRGGNYGVGGSNFNLIIENNVMIGDGQAASWGAAFNEGVDWGGTSSRIIHNNDFINYPIGMSCYTLNGAGVRSYDVRDNYVTDCPGGFDFGGGSFTGTVTNNFKTNTNVGGIGGASSGGMSIDQFLFGSRSTPLVVGPNPIEIPEPPTPIEDAVGIVLLDPNQHLKAIAFNEAMAGINDRGSAPLIIDMGDTDQTVNPTQALRKLLFEATGTLTAARNVILPTDKKRVVGLNSTSGGFDVTFKTAAGSGITVPAGQAQDLLCDGTDIIAIAPPA